MSHATTVQTIYLPKPATPLSAVTHLVCGSAAFGLAAWGVVVFTLMLS